MSSSSFSPAQQRALSGSARVRDLLDLAAATGREVFLVGGCVRDLLQERELRDVDVALRDAPAFAREFAAKTGGTYVPWRKEWGMARVAFRGPAGPVTVDFAELRGETIEQDLRARDLTINAMAAAPPKADRPDWRLIDPLGGRKDLAAKTIRAAGRHAFEDDPLRVLRAFRFAGQLRFSVEPGTLALARASAGRLTEVAAERTRAELVKLFAALHTAPLIRLMDQAGVVEVLWPEALPMKGVDQPGFHHLDVWDHSVATLEELDWVGGHLEDLYGEEAAGLREYLDENEHRAWLKFAALWHDVAKPVTKSLEADGRTRFFGHAERGAAMVRGMMKRLACGQRETEMVAKVVELHLRPLHMLPQGGGTQLSARAVRRFYRAAQGHADGILLLSVADTRATRGPLMRPGAYREFVTLHRELRRVHRETVQPAERKPRLLTGRDLIDRLGLEPGPLFREILEAVAEAQVEGELQTPEEALRFVRERYGGPEGNHDQP